MKKNRLFLNSFWLKIIAIVTMTIDHIGVIVFYQFSDPIFETLYTLCRGIGRLSLPIFAFMIVEGVFHTRSVVKYLTRIGVSAVVVALGLVIGNAITNGEVVLMAYIGNIFIDFLLAGALIACLRLKNYQKFYALIPLALYILVLNLDYDIFYMIYLQYEWYSLGIILVLFASHYLTAYFARLQTKQYQIDYEGYKMTTDYQFTKNIIGSLLFFTYSLAVYFILDAFPQLSMMDNASQVYAIFALVFILFYNGKRGYNKKWFQYGCYAYYAVHIVLLFGIGLLV